MRDEKNSSGALELFFGHVRYYLRFALQAA